MIKKIKTILVLLFCLVIALSYATGCRSDSSNLLQGSSENQAEESEVNLKKIMTVTTKTTITATNLSTGAETVTTTTDTTTKIVEPEKIGSSIVGLKPGEKRKIVIGIQNISAYVNDKITVHFNFVPVDCSGHYYIDEIVSTGDVTVASSGRN